MTTDERIQQAAKKYRNWGKWGNDDQLGTLNSPAALPADGTASLLKP